MRAPASGITLTEENAAIIKGMLERGDRQHDIAAWFGVNGGRIGEISTGERFGDIDPIFDDLPPPGPYAVPQAVEATRKNLLEIKSKIDTISNEIEEQIKKLSGE